MFNEAGRFIGYRGVGRHITERKRIEEALRNREKELREIVETIPAMTVTFTPDGQDAFIGKRFSEYSGLSEEDARGSDWKVAIHPDDLDLYLRKWRASIVSGDPVEFEARVRRSDGEYRWFLARAVAQRDDRGNILKWYEVLTDIEDRKRAEAEARESERRYREVQMQLAHANRVATMGQLTASIAHEVNQPIAATVTNAQAALRWLGAEPPNLDEVRQALGRIVRDGNRAGAVVGRIRNLIKKAPPRDERVDINAAIREVIELTRSEAMKNGVSVQTELVEGLPPVQGDRVELQQVILNLILNAIEAMSEMSEGLAGIADHDGQDRVGRRARRGARFGPGTGAGGSRASLQGLPHDQTERLGAGAVDLPFDHRSAWRTIVGERQCAPRRRLSIHVARPSGHCIAPVIFAAF